jgi:parallel beta-helix repeat protein
MSETNIIKKLISIFLMISLFAISFIGILLIIRNNDNFHTEAKTIIVSHYGNPDYANIQDAIDNASNGDIIDIRPGLYFEHLIVNKSLTLIGTNITTTIIDGGKTGIPIYITSNFVNISNLKITNMNSPGPHNNSGRFSGIKLNNATNVTIMNVNCTENRYGILLNNSHSNMIKNNDLYFNDFSGVSLVSSNDNMIVNNTCDLNGGRGGINLYNSSSNIIINNTCNSNSEVGIEILYFSNNNTIKNNSVVSNYYDGISISNSKENIIINNICKKSKGCGLKLYKSSLNLISNNTYKKNPRGILIYYYSNKNKIKNNSCENNSYGINVMDSYRNIVDKNNCKYNRKCGINLGDYLFLYDEFNCSEYNIFKNNSCSNNLNGIALGDVKNNNIIGNNIFNNLNGIHFSSSKNNYINENIVLNNTKYGILTKNDCRNNYFYHNQFLYNNNQTNYKKFNWWNNSYQEGNYWSDYKGIDNGADGRPVSDGIGDTKIPHLGLDNYPFTDRFGWLLPGIPILNDLDDINNDGNYFLNWTQTRNSLGYVLEEDITDKFESPKIIFNDSFNTLKIKNKENNTYFYRVKAYNWHYISKWSNIVNITVDWLPTIPKNLKCSAHPIGNILNLSWDLNLKDTKEYCLEFMNTPYKNFKTLKNISHPIYSYNHTTLEDGQKYFYRIRAKDGRGQFSSYSEIISGIPQDLTPPAPPKGLNVISTTNNSISLVWKPNSEEDLRGYHIYRKKNSKPISWGKPIGTVNNTTEQYNDSGLEEQTTYYYVITAFDEVPNNSGFSNIISGTTLFYQYRPNINNSIADFEIPEDTIDDTSINLFYWFKDKNNDPIVFWVEGNKNISVYIYQNNGTVVLIPAKNWNGKETLIFYASDGISNISDVINITVTPVNDPPGPAIIISPQNGQEYKNDAKINFSAICFDPDIPYGDKLTFEWSSNIINQFGIGQNLTKINFTVGNHQIQLKVTDIVGEFSYATINITILSAPNNEPPNIIDPDKPEVNDTINDTKPGKDQRTFLNAIIIGIIIVIIAIVILIVFFGMVKKKNEVKNEVYESETRQMDLTEQAQIPDSKPTPSKPQHEQPQPQVTETTETTPQENIQSEPGEDMTGSERSTDKITNDNTHL